MSLADPRLSSPFPLAALISRLSVLYRTGMIVLVSRALDSPDSRPLSHQHTKYRRSRLRTESAPAEKPPFFVVGVRSIPEPHRPSPARERGRHLLAESPAGRNAPSENRESLRPGAAAAINIRPVDEDVPAVIDMQSYGLGRGRTTLAGH
ncbi:hypothetical protein CCMA1212_001643 [Trichoderma ghanense]|uniref:Uncharacterized protein n=1 Tax=Trichoderma ghanense TaxID=65468 RepID=A0ABY2HBE7_9HYPO